MAGWWTSLESRYPRPIFSSLASLHTKVSSSEPGPTRTAGSAGERSLKSGGAFDRQGWLCLDRACSIRAVRAGDSGHVKTGTLRHAHREDDAQTGKAVKEYSIETGIADLDTATVTWKPELLRTVTDGEFRTTPMQPPALIDSG